MYANTTSARIGSGFLRSVHISRKSGLGLLDDGLEGLRIGDGQFGQSATIKLNAGEVQAHSCPKEGPTVRTSNTLILTGNATERNKIAIVDQA